MKIKEESDNSSEDEFKKNYINEIRDKVNIMKKNDYRTSHFSLIEYFVRYDFIPLNKDFLLDCILIDYKKNPGRYVLAKGKEIFKSEISFMRSVKHYMSKNNSFVTGPTKKELSLNLKNTCIYLRSVFKKYTSNSMDVTTPVKMCRNSQNYKRNKDFQIKSNIIYDSDDFDIDIDGESNFNPFSLRSKSNVNNFNYNNKFYDKIKEEKNYNDSFCSNSLINLSGIEIKEEEQEKPRPKFNNNDIYPRIFSIKLIKESLVSSFDKNTILKMQDLVIEYISDMRNRNYSENIEKNLEELNNSLNDLYKYKDSYDKVSSAVNNFQKDMFDVWNLMINLWKCINKNITMKTYDYEIYRSLRDNIYKCDGIYEETLEKLKNNLNLLMDIEMKVKEEKDNIQETLASIKYRLKYDKNFGRLSIIIEDNLQVNNNRIIDEEGKIIINNDLSLVDGFDFAIKRFKEESKKIMNNMKSLDKSIGNIQLYL